MNNFDSDYQNQALQRLDKIAQKIGYKGRNNKEQENNRNAFNFT